MVRGILEDFCCAWGGAIVKLHIMCNKSELISLPDKEFLLHLDEILQSIYVALKEKITSFNEIKYRFDLLSLEKRSLTLDELKSFASDYMEFRKSVSDILSSPTVLEKTNSLIGAKANRLIQERVLPKITTDVKLLKNTIGLEYENV